MEHLGSPHITRAVVQIKQSMVVGYSHFGKEQAVKNAVKKYERQNGGRK